MDILNIITGIGGSGFQDKDGNDVNPASKLKELLKFLPLLDQYHETIELKEELNEVAVSYLPIIKSSGSIILTQIVLTLDTETEKVYIGRELNRWDLTEMIETFGEDS